MPHMIKEREKESASAPTLLSNAEYLGLVRKMQSTLSETVDWSSWGQQLKTLERMMSFRGYVSVSSIMHGSDPLLVCSARDAQNDLVMVYFLAENKVGVKTLRRIQSECETASCKHSIIVTEDGLTPFAQKELEDPEKLGASTVEVFKKKELSFCIMDHSLVPKHTLLSQTEKKAVLHKLGCKPSSLPRIKDSDPVVRFMRFPVGGLVKIQRNIGSCQEDYYRLVTA
jgi:DNA-directed RNA polymerase subunit H (RpoH/RPB5)